MNVRHIRRLSPLDRSDIEELPSSWKYCSQMLHDGLRQIDLPKENAGHKIDPQGEVAAQPR